MNISLKTFIKWRRKFATAPDTTGEHTKVVKEFSDLFVENLTQQQVFRLLGGNNLERITRLIEEEMQGATP